MLAAGNSAQATDLVIEMLPRNNCTHLFHCVEVVCLDTDNLLSSRLLDLFHLLPRRLVVHKVDRDTLPSETTRTS